MAEARNNRAKFACLLEAKEAKATVNAKLAEKDKMLLKAEK